MSTPAIIYITITVCTLSMWAVLHNKHVKVNAFARLADVLCMTGLLYWGGFFS